jgi:hypothetical protein
MTSLLGAQLPGDPARIQRFEATPTTVNAGEPVELRWVATGTESIRLDPPDQEFPPTGHFTFVPMARTVFWIHASNTRGGQSIPLVVEVIPKEVVPLAVQNPVENLANPVARSGGIWIQLAALADAGSAEHVRKEVLRLTGDKVELFDIDDPDHPGQTLHRLRIGPFSSKQEARKRILTLQPKIRSMRVKPFVAVD